MESFQFEADNLFNKLAAIQKEYLVYFQIHRNVDLKLAQLWSCETNFA